MTWLYFATCYNISHKPSQKKNLHRQIRVSVPSERVATRGPMRHSPNAWTLGPGVGTSSKRWWLTSGKDTKNYGKSPSLMTFNGYLRYISIYKSTISMGMFKSYVTNYQRLFRANLRILESRTGECPCPVLRNEKG